MTTVNFRPLHIDGFRFLSVMLMEMCNSVKNYDKKLCKQEPSAVMLIVPAIKVVERCKSRRFCIIQKYMGNVIALIA